MQIPRSSKKKDASRRKINNKELVDLLCGIPFDKINIPLYTYRCLIRDDDSATGNIICGYIEGYDAETDMFNVVILEKHAACVCNYQNPIIYLRLDIDEEDGKILKIKGIDICPKAYYSFIR